MEDSLGVEESDDAESREGFYGLLVTHSSGLKGSSYRETDT